MRSGSAVVVICIIIALVVLGPLLLIWSANTLFPVLEIPYTLETWFAALIFGGMFSGSTSSSKK